MRGQFRAFAALLQRLLRWSFSWHFSCFRSKQSLGNASKRWGGWVRANLNARYVQLAIFSDRRGTVLEDHLAGFLTDHDRRRIGVARHDVRHDRGIGNPQPRNAVNPQAVIHHRLIIRTHPAGAGRVIDRLADIAGALQQLFIRLRIVVRHVFTHDIGAERAGLRHGARKLDGANAQS